MTSVLVSTSVAAKTVGVHRATLARWWLEGHVIPAVVTPGGHARWDVDELRRQLTAQRRRDE